MTLLRLSGSSALQERSALSFSRLCYHTWPGSVGRQCGSDGVEFNASVKPALPFYQ